MIFYIFLGPYFPYLFSCFVFQLLFSNPLCHKKTEFQPMLPLFLQVLFFHYYYYYFLVHYHLIHLSLYLLRLLFLFRLIEHRCFYLLEVIFFYSKAYLIFPLYLRLALFALLLQLPCFLLLHFQGIVLPRLRSFLMSFSFLLFFPPFLMSIFSLLS